MTHKYLACQFFFWNSCRTWFIRIIIGEGKEKIFTLLLAIISVGLNVHPCIFMCIYSYRIDEKYDFVVDDFLIKGGWYTILFSLC